MITVNITPKMAQLSEEIEIRNKLIKQAETAQTATIRLAREANDLPKSIRLNEQYKLSQIYDTFEYVINKHTYERERAKKKLKKKVRKQMRKQFNKSNNP